MTWQSEPQHCKGPKAGQTSGPVWVRGVGLRIGAVVGGTLGTARCRSARGSSEAPESEIEDAGKVRIQFTGRVDDNVRRRSVLHESERAITRWTCVSAEMSM